MTLNNGSLVSSTIKGVENLSAPQSIDAEPYLMQPQSIKFDRDINGEKNLIVANTGRMEVIIVNRDLKFKKAFGLEGVSRLRGAMESIKAVVTDSTLTAGANFGLGLWSGGTNSKYIGWNNSKDRRQY